MAQEVGALRVSLSLDSADFTKNLTAIDTKLKAFKAEINASTKSGTGFAKGLDELKTKSDILSKALETQKVKVAELKRRYDESVEANGKNSQETDKAATAYNKAVAEMNKMENQLKGITSEIERQTNPWRKLQDTLQQTSQKLKDVGQSMVDVGKNMSMKVTAPIAALGGIMLKTAVDFQASMSKVSAISGATGVDLAKLEAQARELGATTVFSASEAAEGMQYLALAGWKTNEIMSAMPGMLDLAAAGSLSLAKAADITSDVMSAFEIEATKAGHAADVFAYAQANANTNVEQLGEGMKYLAPVANSLNWELEESAAALMALANNGLKGSIAGQAFAASLGRLAKPTKQMKDVMDDLKISFFNAEGQMKPMPELIAELEKATNGLTDQQKSAALTTLFGAEAYKHWAILLNTGSAELAKMTKELELADGTAAKMAKTMQDNAAGKIKEMQSAFEELSIMFANHVLPMFTAMIEKITEWIRKFGELDPSTQKFIIGLAGVSAAVGPVLIGLGSLVKSFGLFVGIAGKAAGAIAGAGGLGAALTALATNPITLTIAGITALGVGVMSLVNHLKKDAIPTVDLFGDGVSDTTKEAVGSFLELNDKATVALNEMTWGLKAVTAEMSEVVVSSFGEMSGQIVSKLEEGKGKAILTMQELLTESVSISKDEQQKILESVQQSYSDRAERVKENEARIKEIMEQASSENRALKYTEKEEINRIQQEMLHTGINLLTENETEQRVILERMKQQAGTISAEQAAEVVRNSIEQKDKVVAEAEDQYNKAIAEIIHLRDEAGVISSEQADMLIKEAERQRDGTIKSAEEQHKRIVEEAQKQAEEHVDKVDWETGEVLSKWEYLKNQTKKKFKEIKETIVQKTKDWGTSLKEWWNSLPELLTNAKDNIVTWFDNLPSLMREKLNNWGQALRVWAEEQNEENKRQFGEWWNSISEWFTSIPEKITSKLKEWGTSITDWFVSIPNEIMMKLSEWGETITNWFSETYESIASKLSDWGESVSSWFIEMPSNIGLWLSEWWEKISTWFSEIPEKITEKLNEWWTAIKNWFVGVPDRPEIKNMGKNMIDKVAQGNEEKKPELLDKLGKIVVDVAGGALALAGVAVLAAGREIIKRLINGIQEAKTSLVDKMTEIKDGIVNKVKEVNLLQIGKDIIQGLIDGISNKFKDVTDKLSELTKFIPQWVKDALQIKSPSRVMMAIGSDIGTGLAIGIEQTKKDNEKAISDVTKIIEDVAKKHSDEIGKVTKKQADEEKKIIDKKNKDIANIHALAKAKKRKLTISENQRIQKIEEDAARKLVDIRKKHGDALGKEAETMSKKRLDAVKLYVQDKKSVEEMSLATEAQVWKQSLSLFKEGTKERVEVQKAYQKTIETINKEVEAINKTYVDNAKKLNDDYIKEEQRLTKEYEDTLEKRVSALTSFANIFEEIREIDVSGSALIQALQSQVTAFENWQKNITELAARGINEGLLAELREMGPKAGAEIAALNSLTDSELQQYVELWQQKNELARQQAEAELTDLRKNTEKQIDELKRKTVDQLRIYQNEWRTSMVRTKGEVKNELSEMPSIGQYAVSGLIDGMWSMQGQLISAAQALADIVASTFQDALDIHSPSRVMRGFGVNIGEGLILGLNDMIGKVSGATRRLADSVKGGVPIPTNASFGSVSQSTTNNTSKTEYYFDMNFYSPKAIDPYEASRMSRNALKEASLQL